MRRFRAAGLPSPGRLGGWALRPPRGRDPHEALATLLALLYPAPEEDWGVHPSAVVHPEAVVHAETVVGPNSVIGTETILGRGVRIGANCVVGERVEVGEDTILFPNVTVYADAVLGRRVIGTRCADRSRRVRLRVRDGAHTKAPRSGARHRGRSRDRGELHHRRRSFGSTRIGAGSKTGQSLSMRGTTFVIGRGGRLWGAQVGIAGSTRMVMGSPIGGQAGSWDT